MADIQDPSWSEIDASNNATPPAGWPEGMQPSDVNNSARAQMGGEKRWYDRGNSTQTTTGTNTAYVLTYASTQSALYDGFETSFILDQACGATPTLNVDGLGARTMRKYDLATSAFIAIGAGDFLANQVLRVRYNLTASRYEIIAASFWPGAFPTVLSPINLLNSLNEAEVTMGAAPTMNIGVAAGNYIKVVSNFSAVVTITIASPAVIGATAHGLLAGAAGTFATTGALPTGLVAGTTYYVINPTTNTFQVATTPGGTAINTSGTQSGVQTFTSSSSISAFDTIQAGAERKLEFANAVTVVHNGTSLILPNAVNIQAAAGDVAAFTSEGFGNWRLTSYLHSVSLPNSIVSLTTGAVATGATNLPFDDTIPQITEGNEYMSLAITPKDASSTLYVSVVTSFSSNSSDNMGVALFRDSGANAVAAMPINSQGAGVMVNATFTHSESSGSTAATTFRVRIGGSLGSTITFNGTLGTRLYGGVVASSITITEVIP